MKWKMPNGNMGTAALLYPDHFDSTRKYPVIFIYYEKDNSSMRFFKAYGEGYYPDQGYFTCNPDIYYSIGETGPSAYDAVVSAAEALTARPYIDKAHMGIMGGSFSGYETNYIVTHSHLFAAAISGCGMSDLFSAYGSYEVDSQDKLHSGDTEVGQHRMGVTPWERPDLYIRNSPIFYADKVTTPLLLYHNRGDERVPFFQGIEFFKALRRLGKRAWLLQYDDETHCGCSSNHGGGSDDSPFDQFFAYYLKGAPAPRWMLEPIPARLKATSSRLFMLDSAGRTPGPGLLMDKEIETPQQRHLLEHRTRVTEDGRIEAVND
jgi:dipeptidyl aminopeptidase/acylaminoacyl peptidase